MEQKKSDPIDDAAFALLLHREWNAPLRRSRHERDHTTQQKADEKKRESAQVEEASSPSSSSEEHNGTGQRVVERENDHLREQPPKKREHGMSSTLHILSLSDSSRISRTVHDVLTMHQIFSFSRQQAPQETDEKETTGNAMGKGPTWQEHSAPRAGSNSSLRKSVLEDWSTTGSAFSCQVFRGRHSLGSPPSQRSVTQFFIACRGSIARVRT